MVTPLLIYSIVSGIFSGYVAEQKGRSPLNWFLLGAVFGLFALIAVAAVPAVGNASDRPQAKRQNGIRMAMLVFTAVAVGVLVIFS